MTEQLFGLDFGTTNSLAALVVGDKVRSLTGDNDRPHPSVVWYRGDQVVVGRAARNHLDLSDGAGAQNIVRSPKMALRRDGPLFVDGRAVDPTDVIADVFKYLRQHATSQPPHYQISRAVMTIPVDFGGPQRRQLRAAARKAGIRVIQFVHEPAAALYAHIRSRPDYQRHLAALEGKAVLVFDWGGGTLDLTLVRILGGTLMQVASRGNNQIGGDEFDKRLRNHVRDAFATEKKVSDLASVEQPDAATVLLARCELAKIELSTAEQHDVLVKDYLRSNDPATRHLAVELTRPILQRLTSDLAQGLNEIDRILDDAKLDRRDIELCLPTGGMVNMPAIREGLVERFSGRVADPSNGDRLIAEGAAWIAHDGLRLTLAKPLHVLVSDGSGRGSYVPIIGTNLKLPVEDDVTPVPARRFFCIDPRDGVAVFEFAKPRGVGSVEAPGDPEFAQVINLPVDPTAPPFRERLECELQIDHDYVVKIVCRSLGRGEVQRAGHGTARQIE